MVFLYSHPIITIYYYLFIFILFFILYQDVSQDKNLTFFIDFHNVSKDLFRKLMFILILLTLLGTPVTLGFIYKLLIINNLTQNSIMLALTVNLIMIIFYLQFSRYPQLNRKKRQTVLTQNTNINTKAWAILSAFLTLSSLITSVVWLDTLTTFFS